MMTQNTDQKPEQIQMFCMDDLVPQDHLLRLIDKAIDWSFIDTLISQQLIISNCCKKTRHMILTKQQSL